MAIDDKDYERFEEKVQALVGVTPTELDYLGNEPKYSDKPYELGSDTKDILFKYTPLLWLQFGYKPNSEKTFYTLGIIGTWHILLYPKSVCSYFGAYNHDGKLLENLKIIENRTVKRVIFIREKLNLFLKFDNQYWIGIVHDKNQVSGFTFNTIYDIGDSRSGYGEIWAVVNGEMRWSVWLS